MRYLKSSILLLATSTIFLIFTSCKDNSTSSDDISVEITDGSAAVIELNTCDIDSGSFATEFRFTLQLDAPSDVDIDGIEFDVTFQSGAEISSLLQDLSLIHI